MTPCEKLGYKVGDRFECVEGNVRLNRYAGDILVLKYDDGSEYPWFENVTRKEKETVCYLECIQPLKSYLKSGDEITQGVKKYRVTLEEIPQYEFKPGMMCKVVWDGSEVCADHTDYDRVVYISKERHEDGDRHRIAYLASAGIIVRGYVKTSNLRPE